MKIHYKREFLILIAFRNIGNTHIYIQVGIFFK